jgi:peptidoglycan hydrolase FlgJ
MDKLPTVNGADFAAQTQLSQQTSELNKAKNLSKQPFKSEAEVDKAAGGFEALLLHQMLKAMWSTVETTGLLGEKSNQAQVYQDMFHQSIADSVAEGRGIGVKQFLKKELLKTMKKASEGI